jgi:hypothetical protein
MTGPAMDVTLTNWVPRGQTAATGVQVQASTPVNVNSAQDVLSVMVNESVTANELQFVFEIKRLTNASYVEYFYNRPSNTVLISGQDDSSKRLSLRFVNGASADRIVVYVNGVEMPASGYDRSVSGRIVFNQALVDETNQIRVLVYKQDASSYVTLNFVRNDLAAVIANQTSAWGNVEKTAYPKDVQYSVFTCHDVSGVMINSRLMLTAIKDGSTVLPTDVGYLVIADAPYSSYDRNLNVAISTERLIDGQELIEYKKDVKNSSKFYVAPEIVQSMFPPITIKSRVSDDVDSNKTNDSNTKLMNVYIT